PSRGKRPDASSDARLWRRRSTGYGPHMGDSQAIVIGLLAAHDDRDLADTLAADLPPALREQVGDGTRWATEVCAVEPADATAGAPELVDAVRRAAARRRVAARHRPDDAAV